MQLKKGKDIKEPATYYDVIQLQKQGYEIVAEEPIKKTKNGSK